jgi:hypothetical protein
VTFDSISERRSTLAVFTSGRSPLLPITLAAMTAASSSNTTTTVVIRLFFLFFFIAIIADSN